MKTNNDLNFSKELAYLFNTGKNFQCYNLLGTHKMSLGKEFGYLFSVWAPNAKCVSVVCDKNNWNPDADKMFFHKDFGIWTLFMENIKEGEKYKFCITTQDDKTILKADPFAFFSEVRPQTASVTTDLSFDWGDELWLKKRKANPVYDKPVNIYELHFGSWKKHADGSFYTYVEMAEALIPYIKEMGYTHIELLPICEYPFDGSWGYQVTGYYSANSRFGSPKELKHFINECHKEGIGVIMDWVPAHFPKDAHGLSCFDGTHIFEHPDWRLGEHKEWGTLVFNWEKSEVHSFLISNAVFWLSEYHFDGLRVDAVSSMLYLDYNRKDGEWVQNKYGGNENLAAIEFLQKLNTAVFEKFPDVLMVAEESTAWPMVTKPVHDGGLGFNFKWNMGWMNDILRFMAMDPYFRGSNLNMLTFSMMYAYSENYILALSHDEVVHGKKSLIDKMFGTYEQKFKSLKLLYSYMYAHPGKKLTFMGNEFGQFLEWRYKEELDWVLFDYETHRNLSDFVKELNHYYKTHRSMYENDFNWDGFSWIDANDWERCVVSFKRTSLSKRDKTICVFNFAMADYDNYSLGVDQPGSYEIVLSTDKDFYNNKETVFKAKKTKNKMFKYEINIPIPELSGLYIRKCPRK